MSDAKYEEFCKARWEAQLQLVWLLKNIKWRWPRQNIINVMSHFFQSCGFQGETLRWIPGKVLSKLSMIEDRQQFVVMFFRLLLKSPWRQHILVLRKLQGKDMNLIFIFFFHNCFGLRKSTKMRKTLENQILFSQNGFGLPGLWNLGQTCRALSFGSKRCS